MGTGAGGLRELWVRERRAALSSKLQTGLSQGQDWSHGMAGVVGVTVRNLERIICQGSVWILEGWLGPSWVVCMAAPGLPAGLPQQAAWNSAFLHRSHRRPLGRALGDSVCEGPRLRCDCQPVWKTLQLCQAAPPESREVTSRAREATARAPGRGYSGTCGREPASQGHGGDGPAGAGAKAARFTAGWSRSLSGRARHVRGQD